MIWRLLYLQTSSGLGFFLFVFIYFFFPKAIWIKPDLEMKRSVPNVEK